MKGPAFVAGNSIGGFMCANLAVRCSANGIKLVGWANGVIAEASSLFAMQADYPQLVRGLALINSAGPITPNYDAGVRVTRVEWPSLAVSFGFRSFCR